MQRNEDHFSVLDEESRCRIRCMDVTLNFEVNQLDFMKGFWLKKRGGGTKQRLKVTAFWRILYEALNWHTV